MWTTRSVRSSDLQTTDGRSVLIISPGRHNDGSGPDIRGAICKIGDVTLTGDIEFHQTPSEWNQHGHHRNAAYNRVILHVVLNAVSSPPPAHTKSGRVIPLLPLAPYLNDDINLVWGKFLRNEQQKSSLACFGKTRAIPHDVITRWVLKMDTERVELRILRLQERFRELIVEKHHSVTEPRRNYGQLRVEGFPEEIPIPEIELSRKELTDKRLWEQVMYEGLMEGLGYSRNRVPFIRLARAVPLNIAQSLGAEPILLASLLYGTAGLLPRIHSLKERLSRSYVRRLVREWNVIRRKFAIDRIHPAEWQFSPTRPHNFLTIRIAAAVEITGRILLDDMFRTMVQIIKSDGSSKNRWKSLQSLFMFDSDEFWSHHYHFDRPTKHPISVLGLSRINDLLVNTVFPLLLLYARVFTDGIVRERVHALRRTFPPLSENSSTRVMNRELFFRTKHFQSLRLQQGSIQLYRYYCTKGRCGECDIGKRVFRKN